MALTKSSRTPKRPATRLAMIFRELAINGKKDWRNWIVFAQHGADEGDADMQKVIECYRGLKRREQQTITPESICDLAGVNPNDLAAEVFRSYLSYASDAANLIEAASRPAVVRKQVKVALTTDGWRDRKMLHEHSGFLPQKTGGGIHVNASANAENQNATVVSAPELKSMESDTIRFTRVLKGDAKVIESTEIIEAPARVPALTGGEERT